MSEAASSSRQYEAPAPMSAEQKALIEKENHYRHLFAETPGSSELQDAHLLLENVFVHESEYVFQDETEEEKKVPKLLTQCRKLGLTGKAIVSQNEFMARWTTFTNGILNGLDWTNVFCAGGAVLANLIADNAGYNSSDIDLFLYGVDSDEAANAKLREIHALVVKNTGGRGDVIRTARAVTILNNHPFRHVQVVLRCYKSPAEVLLGFDIDSCTVGYDGTNIYCMERFKRALTKRYNLVNISRRSLTYEQRLYKYSRRGFAVAVPNLDKSRVNQEVFTKQVKDLFGLSKLLLYDYIAQMQITQSRNSQGREARNFRIEHQNSSDYNGEMEIPWGPNFSTQRILSILKIKDRRQFFSQINKAKKAQGFGQSQQQVKKAEHLFETIFFDTTNTDGSKNTKIEWIRNNPAYQDLDGGFTRPLMTGSFQLPPPVQAVWDLDSYSATASNPVTHLSNDQGYVPGEWVAPAQASPAAFTTVKKMPRMEPSKSASDSASNPSAPASASNPSTRGGFITGLGAGVGFPDFGTGGKGIDLSAFGGPSTTAVSSFGSFGASAPHQATFTAPAAAASSADSSGGVFYSPNKFSVTKRKKESPEATKRTVGGAGPSPSSFKGAQTAGPAPTATFGSTATGGFSGHNTGFGIASGPAVDMGALTHMMNDLKAFVVQAIKGSSSLQHPTGQEEAPPTTKLLLLVSLCHKQGSITQDEKATLKDLIIARNEAVFSALEVFEIDQDIEDLVDTFKRIVKSKQTSQSF